MTYSSSPLLLATTQLQVGDLTSLLTVIDIAPPLLVRARLPDPSAQSGRCTGAGSLAGPNGEKERDRAIALM